MASMGSQYPEYLNPFGGDDTDDELVQPSKISHSNVTFGLEQYPDHLDPFNDHSDLAIEEQKLGTLPADDYDDSLNPFGVDEDEIKASCEEGKVSIDMNKDDGNPFAEEICAEKEQQDDSGSVPAGQSQSTPAQRSPSPELVEPPKPLPRTKSLLKKEQANKKRLQEQQLAIDNQTNSLLSTTSSASTSSIPESNNHQTNTATVPSQRQKNKRLAPPVPINFKRQVSGSLDAIQEELNEIGDKLEIIDKDSTLCQQTLTSGDKIDEISMNTVRSKFVELIKRRNSIVRRQKELMYKKRELKLDQLYSDIEYELRMIGNKQQSTRTKEDEQKEKELLKKLVEVVEEKNDIIENLNRDTSCDNRDIEEAFKRLNLSENVREDSGKIQANNTKTRIVSKGSESCDKKGIARLSKIATLLPRGDTIRMKRKRLFKKNCDSRPIER